MLICCEILSNSNLQWQPVWMSQHVQWKLSGSPRKWANAPLRFTLTEGLQQSPLKTEIISKKKKKNWVWSTWNQKNHRLKHCAGKCNKQRVYDFFGCPWGNTHPSSPISHSDAIHVNTVVRVSARSSLLLKLQVTYCQLRLCYWTVVQKKQLQGCVNSCRHIIILVAMKC